MYEFFNKTGSPLGEAALRRNIWSHKKLIQKVDSETIKIAFGAFELQQSSKLVDPIY